MRRNVRDRHAARRRLYSLLLVAHKRWVFLSVKEIVDCTGIEPHELPPILEELLATGNLTEMRATGELPRYRLTHPGRDHAERQVAVLNAG